MSNNHLTNIDKENGRNLWLFIVTTICLVTLIGLGANPQESKRETLYSGSDKGRNERSTPRSFILPATPAVALRQEIKREKSEREVQIKYCVLKLYDLGYEIMSFEDIFDIRIFTALMDFQAKKGLPISGELTTATMEQLDCRL